MKRFGLSLVIVFAVILSVVFSYYMTKKTEVETLSVENVYAMAVKSGYSGTIDDFTNEFRGAIGNDGRGIIAASVNAMGHLIITYSDMTTADAGPVGGDITVTEGISGEAISYALSSTVSIFSKRSTGDYNVGAGVIYKLDKESGAAYVITNNHVLYDATVGKRIADSDISIYLYGKEYPKFAIKCELVGASVDYDIAVLRIKNSEAIKNSTARPARIADSELISILDPVVAVGNPLGYGISASQGNVNVESENRYLSIAASGGEVFMRVIRFDASINKGNSGGGLYNESGELIGIVTARESEATNLSFAVPSNVAVSVADNIIHYCLATQQTNGRVVKLGIGLEVIDATVKYDPLTEKSAKIETVAVKSVESGSLAERAGISVGDIVKSVSLNGRGTVVTRVYHAPEVNIRAREGDVIVYNILRGGEEIQISITVPSDLAQMP